MFVTMIHRIDTRAEKQRDNALLKDLKHVEGKTQILLPFSLHLAKKADARRFG